MNAMRLIVGTLGLTTLLAALMATSAKTPRLPQDPREVPHESMLSSTEVHADLTGDGTQESLLAVNALTGDSDPARGSEVMFAIAAPGSGKEKGRLLWVRHVMAETGQPAHDGDMTVVDLDGDGRSEILLTWDRSISANRVERQAEIYGLDDPSAPRKLWEGEWERDTRQDKEIPAAKREWFRREIDYRNTRKAAGTAIVLTKRTDLEGGVKIDPPRKDTEWVKVQVRAAAH